MRTKMYLMANDTKWLELEEDLDFVPYPGLSFDGIAGEQSLKISGASYNVKEKYFKVRLAWLTIDPLNSQELLDLDIGWSIVPLTTST
jgi:hypothetical protein